MTKKEFNSLDDSVASFELIKLLSEEKWKDIEHLSSEFGKGMRVKGLKWKKGLSESEIEDFENQLGFKFPQALKNYYSVMNGLAIVNENFSEDEEIPFYQMLYRSYPKDIELIKDSITFECKFKNISKENLDSEKIPMIFNYCGNRYLIFDENQQVLSIHQGDAIYFGINLSIGLAKDIFNNFMDTKIEDLLKYKPVKCWLENKYWS
ncbi:SMI1/KNR4 family protein [uncultured Aquimarina sp.]|uniref:SMI1/KNR4 family protein n=1 Tax=uncultured Aquimarina sp. TaxID=575652 RepID=UPI0026238D1B|nr:SMI1/KNR4 family protein [uncultured Aquimarina sp.]